MTVAATLDDHKHVHPTTLAWIDQPVALSPLLLLLLFFILKRIAPQRISSSVFFKKIALPFESFLMVQEAEESEYSDKSTPPSAPDNVPDAYRTSEYSGRTIALTSLAVLETVGWLVILPFLTLRPSSFPIPSHSESENGINAAVMSFTWAYCAGRTVSARWKTTPFYDCFAIYVVVGTRAVVLTARYLYDSYVYRLDFFRHPAVIVASIINIGIIASSLSITLATYVEHPGAGTRSGLRRDGRGLIVTGDGRQISPEDYTTLWKWFTMAWLDPIMEKSDIVKEEDVWELTPPMATRPLYSKYNGALKESYPDGEVTMRRFFWH